MNLSKLLRSAAIGIDQGQVRFMRAALDRAVVTFGDELVALFASIFPVVIFQRNTISVPDRRPPHYVSIFADQSEHAQSGYLAFKRRFSWTAGKEK